MEFLIMDPYVIQIQQRYRNDIFALHAVTIQDVNRANRHASYRQFVLWQVGKLGEGNRRTVPSCCVWRIRDTYPDPNNIYTGFRAGRLG
jgi:hypothetical protein